MNALIARAADAVVAIGGACGDRLSEIALAMKAGRPVEGVDPGTRCSSRGRRAALLRSSRHSTSARHSAHFARHACTRGRLASLVMPDSQPPPARPLRARRWPSLVLLGVRYLAPRRGRCAAAGASRGRGAGDPRAARRRRARWSCTWRALCGVRASTGCARGERVADAVRRAGGATRRADLGGVNLAAELEDGRQVIVPRRGAAAAGGPACPRASGARRPRGAAAGQPQHRDAEQLDTLDRRRAGDRAEDPRVPRAARRLRLGRGARPGARDRRRSASRRCATRCGCDRRRLEARRRGCARHPRPRRRCSRSSRGCCSGRAPAGAGGRRSPALVRRGRRVGTSRCPAAAAARRRRPRRRGASAAPRSPSAAARGDAPARRLRRPRRGRAGRDARAIAARAAARTRAAAGARGRGVRLLAAGRARGGRPRSCASREARARAGGGPPASGERPWRCVRPRSRRSAPFDAYQRRRGAHAAIAASAVGARGGAAAGSRARSTASARRAEPGCAAACPRRRRRCCAGWCSGRTSALAEPCATDFQRSGLAHLLAVCGQNVMLLALLVLAASPRSGPRRCGRGCCRARARRRSTCRWPARGPSIQRAGVMGAAGLVAALAGRPASRWYALGLAAAVTLALNPRAAAEPGWQLSFAAVAGLLALVAARCATLLARRGLPGPVAEAAALTRRRDRRDRAAARAPLRQRLARLAAGQPARRAGRRAGHVARHARGGGRAGRARRWRCRSTRSTAPLLGLPGLGGARRGRRAATRPLPVRLAAPRALALAYALPVAASAALGRLAAPRCRIGAGARRRAARTARWRWLAAAAVRALVAGAPRVAAARGGRPRARAARGELVVSFLDVGQGDATLLQRAGAAVLVDTGPPRGPILRRAASGRVCAGSTCWC